MTLTADEKRTVFAVFTAIQEMPYKQLNSILGSVTIQEMQNLTSKLRYENYCDRHGIKYEDMTEDDFIDAYFEENDDA